MGVVLLQILQWILRIILFLLLLLLVLLIIVLIVPIRYRAEGDFLEKKPGIRGKVTWFFYLIYMKFCYEGEFRMQVRVLGFKVFDSIDGASKPKAKKKNREKVQSKSEDVTREEKKAEESLNEGKKVTSENSTNDIVGNNISGSDHALSNSLEKKTENADEESVIQNVKCNAKEDDLAAWEKEIEAEAREEAELAKKITEKKEENELTKQVIEKNEKVFETSAEKEKKTFSEKVEDIKSKIQDIIQKIKNIIAKIQDGKLKVEHYLELWNRDETQITFGRAKTKLVRMIIAILPKKWKITGEIGFDDPAMTGQFMGVLGAMYPILGNKAQIVPNFENAVINVEGNLKGHIRLGTLLYQLVSLILNRHCFKFIKLVFDELGSSKKTKKKSEE